MDNGYPQWKTWIWRFVRTGIAGGASTVVAVTVVLQPDFSNAKIYATSIASAFIAGFISSIALMLRDTFGNKRQTSFVDKMPV